MHDRIPSISTRYLKKINFFVFEPIFIRVPEKNIFPKKRVRPIVRQGANSIHESFIGFLT